jgi:hypothetical protein
VEKIHLQSPGPESTRVGERIFFIDEDPRDGDPTLQQVIKIESGRIIWPIQDVYPHFNLVHPKHFNTAAFYATPEEARDKYAAYARYRIDQMLDSNLPDDVAQRTSIQKNLDRLLAQDWQKAVGEARTALESVLTLRSWSKSPIPAQEHLIGDTIVGDDGKEAKVALAKLIGISDFGNETVLERASRIELAYYDDNYITQRKIKTVS